MKAETVYQARTKASARLYKKAKKLFPGGVCHGVRHFAPHPFYAARAKGSRIWDVDDNEYVDFWMGHGALILGHTPGPVVRSLRRQVLTGCQWGVVNSLQIELAQLVSEAVPCAEMVRFCNTGAEATMYACRLARGFTGRNKIAKIEGGWHGYNTDLLAYVHEPLDVPESLGLPDGTQKNIVPLPYNDVEASLDRLRRERKDLAAIIAEPVLGSGGFVPAEIDYLRALREAADDSSSLLIFDEVITGFRLSLGGGQEYFGITPDLATLGKILGGGMPIGAVVGRQDILDLSDPTRAKGTGVGMGGGTFSCNPLTMVAGLETLRYLSSRKDLYLRLGRMGRKARRIIQQSLTVKDRYVVCTGIESLFRTHFAYGDRFTPRSFREVLEKTDRALQGWFKIAMANRGIFVVEGGGSISAAHKETDLKVLEEACANLELA